MASLTKRPRSKNKPWSVRCYDGGGKRREAAFQTNREATKLLKLAYPSVGGPVCLYEDFRNILPNNPCPSS